MDRPSCFRLIGRVILIGGILVAVAIFARTSPRVVTPGLDDDVPDKRALVQIEQFGGKGNLISIEVTTWFASLWHGRRLAYTIAVISVGAAVFCRWAADLAQRDSTE